MNKSILSVLAGAGMLSASMSVVADDHEDRISELEARINELENISLDLVEKAGEGRLARTIDALNLNIGGYFFGEISRVGLEGTPAASASRTTPTRIDTELNGAPSALAYLILKADLGENWEFELGQAFGYAGTGVDEINPSSAVPTDLDNNPLTPNPLVADTTSGQLRDGGDVPSNISTVRASFTVDANIKYKPSDKFVLTLGRSRTPVGILNKQFYPLGIYSPFLPLYLRNPSGTGAIYPGLYNGIQASGKFTPSKGLLTYSAFWGGNTEAIVPGNSLETVSGSHTGLRMSYGTLSQNIEFGLTAIAGKRNTIAGRFDGNRYSVVGADFIWNGGIGQIRGEYYQTNEEDASNGRVTTDDRKTFYIEPLVRLTKKIDFFVRYDSLDVQPYAEPSNPLAPILPIYPAFGEAIEQTVGFFIAPSRNTRIRLGYAERTYKDQNDYKASNLYASAVASF